MVATIKQTLRVEAGGRLSLQSAHLHEGEVAEVIVVVNRADPGTVESKLSALRQLRDAVGMTAERAAAWEADLRAERSARSI